VVFVTPNDLLNICTSFLLQHMMWSCSCSKQIFQKTIQMKNLSLFRFRIDHSAKIIPFVLRSTFLLPSFSLVGEKFLNFTGCLRLLMLPHFVVVCCVESLNVRTKRDFLLQKFHPASIDGIMFRWMTFDSCKVYGSFHLAWYD